MELATFSKVLGTLVLFISISGEAAPVSPVALLNEAFGVGKVEKVSLILTAPEAKELQKRARTPIPSGVYRGYVHSSGAVGVLLIRLVRTKSMATLYVISPQDDVKSIEVLSFLEPPEYEPQKEWLKSFSGKTEKDPVQLRNDITPVTGATLTVQTVTRGVRAALQLARLMRTQGKK